MKPQFRQSILLAVLLTSMVVPACSRRHYRIRADQDAYELLAEKSVGTPWQPPNDYSVYPAADSRLADPSNPDWPLLPESGPTLHEEFVTDDLDAESIERPSPEMPISEPEALPVLRAPPVPSDDSGWHRPPERLPPQFVQVESNQQPMRKHPSVSQAADVIALARYQASAEPSEQPLPNRHAPMDVRNRNTPSATQEDAESSFQQMRIRPISPEYWEVLPESSQRHVLEFESVRKEYERSFETVLEPSSSESRLDLRDIVRLSRLNSREYQTASEQLYVSALNVSLQRFDYRIHFSQTGNGTDVRYTHDRFIATDATGSRNSFTENSLAIASGFQLEKMLATGGNLLARFANDVVLTFNGPNGFASRVSSEMFFAFTQSVLQRDILLDPLIQSERDLVYAARDFTRFRKAFFFDLASQYYNILRTYRRIEIESQNYISFVRTFEQAQWEVRARVNNGPNPVEVDQFEQGMLNGRSNLIAQCNQLEQQLDQLKLTMGLPTEQPIRITFVELDRLTLLDQVEVAVERVRRWRLRVEQELDELPLRRTDLINDSLFMVERLIEWRDLRKRYDSSSVPYEQEITELADWLNLEQARNVYARTIGTYRRITSGTETQPAVYVYLRAADALSAQIRLIDRQLEYAGNAPDLAPIGQQLDDLREQLTASREAVAGIRDADSVSQLLEDLKPQIDIADQLIGRLNRYYDYDDLATTQERNRKAVAVVDRLLTLTEELLNSSGTGLPAVDMDVNDAMLTALIQRLDLMNERGALADDWRRVKLAADDLKSVLNLNASHRIRTDNNQPFDFDFDESLTELKLSLDLPFNRRSQRNLYRRQLINYQAGRRSVMQFEDDIKFAIRNDLRELDLLRVQYPISVTQAALAAEQVISVQLQLALGVAAVRGTDLLLALQTSREALTSVANARINYLVSRAEFVFDLELMQLDEDGVWPELTDTDYQPIPDLIYPPNAGPTYGEISRWVKPSKIMFHLYRHRRPGEQTEIIRTPPDAQQDSLVP